MQSRSRLNDVRDLARFQRKRCLLEFFLHVTLAEKATGTCISQLFPAYYDLSYSSRAKPYDKSIVVKRGS